MMATVTCAKKSRKSTERELADRRKLISEWRELRKQYSIPELVGILRAAKPKRGKGRPGFPNSEEILNAAAEARAKGEPYTRLASRFNMTTKQLIEFIHRHREDFDTRVRILEHFQLS